MTLANASFEELFNVSVLDVIVPVATSGLPSPSLEEPYIDDVWLETLAEEETDRKLAFFGKVHRSLQSRINFVFIILLIPFSS